MPGDEPLSWTLNVDPVARLAAAARGYHCVMSDSPMALIEMDTLTRDLDRGCANLVDVTGLRYDLWRRDGYGGSRAVDAAWNRAMVGYLRSGNALIFMRSPTSLLLTPATQATVESGGLIADDDHYDLYRTVRAPSDSIAATVRSQQWPSRSTNVVAIRP